MKRAYWRADVNQEPLQARPMTLLRNIPPRWLPCTARTGQPGAPAGAPHDPFYATIPPVAAMNRAYLRTSTRSPCRRVPRPFLRNNSLGGRHEPRVLARGCQAGAPAGAPHDPFYATFPLVAAMKRTYWRADVNQEPLQARPMTLLRNIPPRWLPCTARTGQPGAPAGAPHDPFYATIPPVAAINRAYLRADVNQEPLQARLMTHAHGTSTPLATSSRLWWLGAMSFYYVYKSP